MPQVVCNDERKRVQDIWLDFASLIRPPNFKAVCDQINLYEDTGDNAYKLAAITILRTYKICNTDAKAIELLEIAFPLIMANPPGVDW